MSLNAALSNALSGLFSSSKAVELISSNVANANTPGYVKRTLALSTRQVSHGGVTIDVVIRNNANYTLTQYQRSEGDYLNAQTLLSLHPLHQPRILPQYFSPSTVDYRE